MQYSLETKELCLIVEKDLNSLRSRLTSEFYVSLVLRYEIQLQLYQELKIP